MFSMHATENKHTWVPPTQFSISTFPVEHTQTKEINQQVSIMERKTFHNIYIFNLSLNTAHAFISINKVRHTVK